MSFNNFPNGINPKMNVIAWLELELALFEAAVQQFSPYSTWINSIAE